MTASKTLTSIAAAAALVGSIGFAYAQSDTMPPNAGSPADTQVQSPAVTPAPADMSTTPADSTLNNTVDTERAPQADRN